MKNKLLKLFAEKGLLNFGETEFLLKNHVSGLLWEFVLPEPLQICLWGNREDFV